VGWSSSTTSFNKDIAFRSSLSLPIQKTGSARTFLQAGAVDFLSKPFSGESLIGCLGAALGDGREDVEQ